MILKLYYLIHFFFFFLVEILSHSFPGSRIIQYMIYLKQKKLNKLYNIELTYVRRFIFMMIFFIFYTNVCLFMFVFLPKCKLELFRV